MVLGQNCPSGSRAGARQLLVVYVPVHLLAGSAQQGVANPGRSCNAARRRDFSSDAENRFRLTHRRKLRRYDQLSRPDSTVYVMAVIPSGKSLPQRRKEPWHAVSVIGGPGACPPALALQGKRILSDDAPRLPLSTCAWSWNCRCIYRHHRDRRATPRRASDRGQPASWVVTERRIARGRRAED